VPYPRKQFGQHWLRSEKALGRILKAAELTPQDTILEIGPGQGVLTQVLLERAAQVVAVEVDRDLCELLRQKFADHANFRLLEADFLQLDLAAACASQSGGAIPNKVVANIPYNITGPILTQLLGTIGHPNTQPFDSLVLLVQKEVAERITATPGSKTFGALSVRVQYLAAAEVICTVPAGAFFPPPKVDSAVIRLRPGRPQLSAQVPEYLDQLVRLGFGMRRKMLHNTLAPLVSREQLSEVLEQLGLSCQVRAEVLTVDQWVQLSNALAPSLLGQADLPNVADCPD
jgi:16S rRNA (adenine1518-N6/adenine1519-N6)-dimethyltransferase